jgi:CubicO group peptidase (beta-lactamase class C family)
MRVSRCRTSSLLAVLGALLTAGCASVAGTHADTGRRPTAVTTSSALAYPGATWERIASPESAGYSSAGLERVRAKLATLSTTGFIAVLGGRVLVDYGDLRAVSYLASVRKSILSMLIGNHVANGTIRLDKSLAEMGIDDLGGLSAQEKEATVLDLLTARSGVYHAASNPGDNLADAPPRGSRKHGTYQLYSNWDFNALGTVFEKETGRNIYDALDSDLARPLGMQDWDRSIQRKSGDTTLSVHRAYHMNLSTRDMARIGYLMLREGAWNGRQLVPADWVRKTTSAFTPVSEMNPARLRSGPFGYGYLWWVWDGPWSTGAYKGAYTGLGAVGQQISVLPALDLVVAHKTRPGEGRSVSHPQYLEVLDLLVKARCAPSGC